MSTRVLQGTVLIPMTASHLMLSLKKAAVDPKQLWSLPTMANLSHGRSVEGGTVDFAPRIRGGSHEIPETFTPSDEESIEFDSVPRLSQNHRTFTETTLASSIVPPSNIGMTPPFGSPFLTLPQLIQLVPVVLEAGTPPDRPEEIV